MALQDSYVQLVCVKCEKGGDEDVHIELRYCDNDDEEEADP
jgi:hypothetical protein